MRHEWDEIVSYWGQEHLLPIPLTGQFRIALPTTTKDFLEKVGIVRRSSRLKRSLGIVFDLIRPDNVRSLEEHFSSDLPDAMGSWIAIGHCFDRVLCIESESGQIILLDGTPDTGFLTWFVNSSLPHFMTFLTTLLQFFNCSAKRKKQESWIRDLIRSLKTTDADVFTKSTNWWPTFLREVEDGML